MLSGTEILTTAQMRAIEAAAIASGTVTGLQLMERAGAAVAGQIRLRWPKPGRATVLCGPGNNGGDGYVVARHLHRAGWQVRVLGLDNAPGPDAAEMKRRWAKIGGIGPLTKDELRSGPDSDVYVDAMLGLGVSRPVAGDMAELVARLYGRGGDPPYDGPRIVAVDCPSGLCLDSGRPPALPPGRGIVDSPARLTIAFDSPKPGHLLDPGGTLCGELVIADIGLQNWRIRRLEGRGLRPAHLTAVWPPFDIPDQRRALSDRPRRLSKRSGHKFDQGHALIVAGGLGHGGAARLTARSALRVGAGLVTIGPPKSALIDHAGPPDALMRRGIDAAAALGDLLADRRINALCLGPGCGVARAAALLPAILDAKGATVIDADALTALAEAGFDHVHDRCVLTPHLGEFARLFPDLADRLAAAPDTGPACSKLDAAREAAARCGAIVLLKGPDTVIAAPGGAAIIHAAFDLPWLATAGSGDVLAGIITGLLARGLQPLDAAATGAWLHAAAARRFGPGLIADDLPEQIPAVFRDLGV